MRMDDGDGGGVGSSKCFPAGWSLAAKSCDRCNAAAALLFCRSDSMFLCMACDAKVHASVRHERVWMCEVCEQAPASVTCKADAAALCVTCDRDIHSANPLARRHDRVPVVPFFDTAESIVKSTAASLLVPSDSCSSPGVVPVSHSHDDTKLTASFPLQEPITTGNSLFAASVIAPPKLPSEAPDMKSVEFLFSDADNFLDFDYPISADARGYQPYCSSGSDSVVPVQTNKPPVPAQILDLSSENRFDMDFTKSKFYHNSYTPQALSHSVSSSSMDVGVVPDGSSMSEISYSYGRSVSNVVDQGAAANGNQASQLMGMEREARVLRYREKRKNRKFEKTIRYASRKAYAETRPRIKGRFAKRTEIDGDSQVDQLFNSAAAFVGESRYGVVPSF